jgi:hypothetical protein
MEVAARRLLRGVGDPGGFDRSGADFLRSAWLRHQVINEVILRFRSERMLSRSVASVSDF